MVVRDEVNTTCGSGWVTSEPTRYRRWYWPHRARRSTNTRSSRS